MEAQIAVVIGTYNRREQLKECINSIIYNCENKARIYVTDAGSTDGTIDLLDELEKQCKIVAIRKGMKLGQAAAYNEVFRLIREKYTCWLSDDNILVGKGLLDAVKVMECNASIGMIGLKVRDVKGPFKNAPYIGGISEGILNVNQGVLKTKLLLDIGGFNIDLKDYGIDQALTAEVLCRGYQVAYTKKISVFHQRNWSDDLHSPDNAWIHDRLKHAKILFSERYGSSNCSKNWLKQQGLVILNKIAKHQRRGINVQKYRFFRTLGNILKSDTISLLDPIISLGSTCHLYQKLPKRRLNF
jgi:GT2 family glycosyltransferase